MRAQPGPAADLCTETLISKDLALVITVTARLTQLQVISEGVHELVASLWPAGSVGNGRPAVVGLLVCRLWRRRWTVVLTLAAGAVIIASRRALRV